MTRSRTPLSTRMQALSPTVRVALFTVALLALYLLIDLITHTPFHPLRWLLGTIGAVAIGCGVEYGRTAYHRSAEPLNGSDSAAPPRA